MVIQRKFQKYLKRVRQCRVPALDDSSDRTDLCTVRFYNLDNFRGGFACGHNVLDDRHALTRMQRETAPQRRYPGFFLDKNTAHTEMPRNDVTGEDPPDRGRDDHLRLVGPQQISKRCTNRFCSWRIFENPKFLNEAVAVQTARQAKMTVEESTALLQESEQLVWGHVVLGAEGKSAFAFASSAQIFCTAARGSGALVIGLPTTMKSAPASTASAGVAVSF